MTNAKIRLEKMKSEMSEKKSRWPQVMLAIAISLFAYKATAQEFKAEVLKSHQFQNEKGGDVYVVIQRVENVMGTPYQMEIRGSCKSTKYSDASKAPVLHVENFCDLKLSSPKLVGDSLTFTSKEVDAVRFNKATNVATPEQLIKLKPTCLKEAKEVSWSLKNFCS